MEQKAMTFDWHSSPTSSDTKVNSTYKMTQNVRRFMRQECGKDFKFDRPFMQWVKAGSDRTMGDVVKEWKRRTPPSR